MFGLFRRRRDEELAPIEADITAFGEELARLPFDPDEHSDPDLLADYALALDAYEKAKRDFVGDRDREDAADVTRALSEGRDALARVDARLSGRPLRPPCFFDSRHGPSTEHVAWAPEGGATRMIDVCAADAVRLAEGMPPIATGRRPAPSRRSAPVRPVRPEKPRPGGPNPAPHGAQKEPPPFKVIPPGSSGKHRAQGRGNARVRLQRLKGDAPSVLVVRIRAYKKCQVDVFQDGWATTPLRSKGTARLVAPLPPATDTTLQLDIWCDGTWTAWLQPGDTVPIVNEQIASRGSFVCHYVGGPARILMEHKDRGAYTVTELTADFEQGREVLRGTDPSTAEGEVAGPALLHIRAEGHWKFAVTHL
ncbi:hypothetical protein ACQPZP_42195 [Spirillospora sp. CA-142024]|uniref:hypothetical protein n=1 Tax=Spirillospora sp. CA-142024 TaxID=3240036 RepID=UPI003D9467F7